MNEIDRLNSPFEISPPAARPSYRESVPALPQQRRLGVHIVLFLVTLFTTSYAGALTAGVDPLESWWNLWAGVPFSVTLLGILLIHEMGHYTTARHYGVDATLPYFIPAPPFFLIGTFGAFIRMKSPPPNRRALFDVGAAGPWAGLIAAIPAVVLGLYLSEVRPTVAMEGGLQLGEPLLFQLISRLVVGEVAEHMTIVLHPIALAGWFGFLVTFLNLLPIGQLDGGHVAYAFLGRWHRWLARAFLLVVIILGFQGWPGWFMWVVLLAVIGLDHPPTLDPWVGLDPRRKVGAVMTGVIFALTFMAAPFSEVAPSPVFEGERTEVQWHPDHRSEQLPSFAVPIGKPEHLRGIAL